MAARKTSPVTRRAAVPNASSLERGRLERLREICLGLPDATEKMAWGDPTFRVRDRIFVMQKGNYAGGRPSIWLKVREGGQSLLLASKPALCFVPPYVGSKGWIGVYLDGRTIPGLSYASSSRRATRSSLRDDQRANQLGHVAHERVVERIGSVARAVIVRVAKVAGIGPEQRREPGVPKGEVVAAGNIWEESVQRSPGLGAEHAQLRRCFRGERRVDQPIGRALRNQAQKNRAS